MDDEILTEWMDNEALLTFNIESDLLADRATFFISSIPCLSSPPLQWSAISWLKINLWQWLPCNDCISATVGSYMTYNWEHGDCHLSAGLLGPTYLVHANNNVWDAEGRHRELIDIAFYLLITIKSLIYSYVTLSLFVYESFVYR